VHTWARSALEPFANDPHVAHVARGMVNHGPGCRCIIMNSVNDDVTRNFDFEELMHRVSGGNGRNTFRTVVEV
jgi:hypothetical protein